MTTAKSARQAQTLSKLLIAWQQQFMLRVSPGQNQTAAFSRHVFFDLQKRFEPAVSLEIGAHEASFSRQMRKLFPGIYIAAFEASPATFMHFAQSVPFAEEGILYLNRAVCTQDGPVSFNLVLENDLLSGRNSLQPRSDLASHQICVKGVCGDSILADCPEGDVALWIDVEGACDKVLTGFEQSFRKRRIASAYVEVEDCELWEGQWLSGDVIRFFLERDYLPVFCDAEYHNLDQQDGMPLSQYNIIFCRHEDVDDRLCDMLMRSLDHCAFSMALKE